ncbi:hypothetical protein [Methylosinus sp. Sm6]|uniref:hypothetical protein n=1 Tax=Methylosinus sp. Sm6 TaxID=2866948 RepID=UPI001C990928|nr:hypothetical protein [Methylosinus sp. Sm6]MBY6241408.1 hypothetical protein [Methylosinus sp. Sm6]
MKDKFPDPRPEEPPQAASRRTATGESAGVLPRPSFETPASRAPQDALDRAVAAAYGWPEEIATEEALAKLLELNLARAAAQTRA